MRSINLVESNKQWQHVCLSYHQFLLWHILIISQPWLLAHRVHLHNALKNKALENSGLGEPITLQTSSKIEDVDVKTATVFLQGGQSVSGDLILGADGVHSVTRKKIKNTKPYGSGKSAFRFLISKKLTLEDPALSKLFQTPGELVIWYHTDRRIVVYPTTNNEQLNFVCIHPEGESEVGGESWNISGHVDRLLEVYKDFESPALSLLGKADPATLKTWKLLDMEILPTWVNEKLALLGDAAHPFLPHQGQGAACAIEDAASLAVVFPADTPKNEIEDRLKLYEEIRYERANKIQQYSRLAGADFKEGVEMDSKFISIAFTNFPANEIQCKHIATTISAMMSGTTPRTNFENGLGHEIQTHIGVCQLLLDLCQGRGKTFQG